MMATLLLYCYCRGRRSSREIEMATFDDVCALVTCGGLHPEHSTVAEFVRRHLEAVPALLPESVKACAREGLVSLDLVAGDGTKLKANASMASNRTAEQLDAEIAELEDLIAAEFRQWARDMLDAEDTPDGPDDPDGGGAPDDADDDGAPGALACAEAAAEPDDADGSSGTEGKKGKKKKPKRPRQALEARRAARAELDARQDDDQEKLRDRAAELATRLEKKEAAVTRWEQQAAARIAGRARKEASGQRISGTRPIRGTGQD